MKSNQNTPGVKKQWPRTKTGLAEKEVKSNGRPRPPGFDRFKSFGHDNLTAKHCYFRCSVPPNVDGIKIFDKNDQATKTLFFLSKCFASWSSLSKKLIPSTLRGLEHLK